MPNFGRRTALSILLLLASSGLAGTAVAVQATAIPEVHTVSGQPAQYEHGEWSGGVGLRGKFEFTNGGDDTVSKYRWRIDGGWKSVAAAPDEAGTSKRVAFLPDQIGLYRLMVQAWGADGWSTAQEHQIWVAPATQAGVWELDEGTGSTATDGSGRGHDLALSPSTGWVDGEYEGSALVFDSIDDVALTDGPVTPTTERFGLGVWVRLDQTSTGVAMSARAGTSSAVSVGYRADDADCPAAAGANGCFQVWTTGKDGAVTAVARSARPVKLGTWYFVAAAYDPTVKGAELAVLTCDRVGPQYLDIGTAPLAKMRRAGGPVEIGRESVAGEAVNGWSGAIDRPVVLAGKVDDLEGLRYCLG